MFTKILDYLFNRGLLFFKNHEVKTNESNLSVSSETTNRVVQQISFVKSKQIALQLLQQIKDYDITRLDLNPFSDKLLYDIDTKFINYTNVVNLIDEVNLVLNLQLDKLGEDFYLDKFQAKYSVLNTKSMSLGVFMANNSETSKIYTIKTLFCKMLDKIEPFLTLLVSLFSNPKFYEHKQIYYSLQLEDFLTELGKLLDSIYLVGVEPDEAKEI